MPNGLTFEIINIFCEIFTPGPVMILIENGLASAKFQGNRFKIDGEIAENHAILVDHF